MEYQSMHYLGGKYRLRKQISSYLRGRRAPHQIYVEPFVGAAWVMAEMDGVRFAYDIHEPLIAMWQALQSGWEPPSEVTEQMYYEAKAGLYELPLTAFIGFGCSFSGKYFGGYARDGGGRNYALNAKRGLLKILPSLSGVHFDVRDALVSEFSDTLLYCDPPYEGTTSYSTGAFDYDKFWNKCREWSENNTVIISSYKAPSDFKIVAEFATRTDMRDRTGALSARIERLFEFGG